MVNEPKRYKYTDTPLLLQDDGPGTSWPWEPQEIAQLQDALKMTHAERFRLMIRLIRIGNMLRKAKITHQKID